MFKISDNQLLTLKYKKGFGAWTYHLVIPGTAGIEGKWGFLKVSGWIDDYELKPMNLAPRKGEDKLISINQEIRTSIGKKAGDTVKVTLYLHSPDRIETNAQVLKCFEDAGVLKQFNHLENSERVEIVRAITDAKTDTKQITLINHFIDKLMPALKL